MKLLATHGKKTNLRYHPTWYIGKIIEFREGNNHQMIVDGVQRVFDVYRKDLGAHFIGRLVLHGNITPLTISSPIRGVQWWLAQGRRRKKRDPA